MQPNSVFLSYRRADSRASARHLCEHLTRAFGKRRVFMDVDSIPAGEDFVQVINQTLAHCQVVLVMVGPNWLSARDKEQCLRLEQPNDPVRVELETALTLKRKIIPLLVDGAHMPQEQELPESLKLFSRINALSLTDEYFKHDVQKLIDILRNSLPKQPPVWLAPLQKGAWVLGAVGALGAVAWVPDWAGYIQAREARATAEAQAQQAHNSAQAALAQAQATLTQLQTRHQALAAAAQQAGAQQPAAQEVARALAEAGLTAPALAQWAQQLAKGEAALKAQQPQEAASAAQAVQQAAQPVLTRAEQAPVLLRGLQAGATLEKLAAGMAELNKLEKTKHDVAGVQSALAAGRRQLAQGDWLAGSQTLTQAQAQFLPGYQKNLDELLTRYEKLVKDATDSGFLQEAEDGLKQAKRLVQLKFW